MEQLNFKTGVILKATPQQVYNAWLDSHEHAVMTGGTAESGNRVGDSFSAWDGYISGKNLDLEEGKRIVQSWRTSDFKETDAESTIEIILEPSGHGCRLTLNHYDIPANQPDYEQGWQEHYFDGMKAYFADSK